MILNFLIELKNRLILIIGMWSLLIITSYLNKETLLFLFTKPYLSFFSKNSLYFISTNLTELFISYLNISYFIANQVAIIYFCYHLIIFLIPGFYYREFILIKKYFLKLLILYIFFILIFNKIFIPFICKFFLKLQNILNGKLVTLYFEAKINEYLNFYVLFYKHCFLSYLSFLFLIFLNTQFSFNKTKLIIKNTRRYFYIIFIGCSTILSPPEITFQILLNLSFIFIYEFVIITNLLRKFFNLKRKPVKTNQNTNSK
uniref:Sec-independent protein translocase component TatC n=1 Tax=Lithodesmium undulatum TaxID=59812 RepID=A0A7T6UZP4_LITUN|nr:Sec-independent protein translocase component TatC [Lithodesmium undulatum]QQJ94654.1 Sec-independent protein translocase component TatC [Lithodesmium undulatum]